MIHERKFKTYEVYFRYNGWDQLCLWPGRFIQRRETLNVERFEVVISILSDTLDTNMKRHMVGGILLSVSMLFAGLALTAITIKKEEDDYEEQID